MRGEKQIMKESRYNFFYESDEDSNLMLAYNARTNALATLKREKYEQLPSILAGELEGIDEKYLHDLEYGGFIVHDDTDELAILRYRLLTARLDRSMLSFTLAPTLGCNFDCIYCYETDHDNFQKMDQSVQDALVQFLERQAPQLSTFSVSWYGGEPLLAFDVIENLTKRFLEVCEKHEVQYGASIITNGYLLTKPVAEKLKDLRINSIQITLDGPEEIHDKRRYKKGGFPTYRTILKNIQDNLDILPSTSIRINTDKKNAQDVERVLEDLKAIGAQTKVHPYLGHVDSANDQYDENLCLRPAEFQDIYDHFDQQLIHKSFKENLRHKYPQLRTNNCCADHINGFVIDPAGNMYLCWNDIGLKEHCIGSILSSNQIYSVEGGNKALINYLYDPTVDEKCKECKVLPLCMGGCPYHRVHNFAIRCLFLKEDTESFIRVMAKEFAH